MGLHERILDTEPDIEPTMLEKKLFGGLKDQIETCDELKVS